jgi:predicted  nucleic acid-binding Zn-ribbon protein
MERAKGMTAELYKAIVAVVDERVKEIRVTREDFDALRGAVSELAQAQARTEIQMRELAQAQARTDASVRELAQAQARTEERVGSLERAIEKLAQAQARTEERVGSLERAMEKLTQAQARTEERVGSLERAMGELARAQARTEVALRQLAQQVGALSENIGYGLEDIARLVLPGYLRWRYGLRVDKLTRRLFWVDETSVDIDLYGEGERDGRKAVVLGEVKSRIHKREVDEFRRKLDLVGPQVEGEVVPVMFSYFIDLSAMEAAGDEMLLVASYQPAVEMASG